MDKSEVEFIIDLIDCKNEKNQEMYVEFEISDKALEELNNLGYKTELEYFFDYYGNKQVGYLVKW